MKGKMLVPVRFKVLDLKEQGMYVRWEYMDENGWVKNVDVPGEEIVKADLWKKGVPKFITEIFEVIQDFIESVGNTDADDWVEFAVFRDK